MDSAFPSARYPGYSIEELRAKAAAGTAGDLMLAEIQRRERVEAGDMDAMTPGERLAFVKKR